jgi:hypothetical protein
MSDDATRLAHHWLAAAGALAAPEVSEAGVTLDAIVPAGETGAGADAPLAGPVEMFVFRLHAGRTADAATSVPIRPSLSAGILRMVVSGKTGSS